MEELEDDVSAVVPKTDTARRVVDMAIAFGCRYANGGLSDARGESITGSELSAFLGENRFETPSSARFKKVFGMRVPENDAMRHGKKYEPVALAKFKERTGAKLFFVTFMTHPKFPFVGGTFDGLAIMPDGEGVLVECKCPFTRSPGNYVPDYYVAQVQTYLAISGLDTCMFVQYKPAYTTPARHFERAEKLIVTPVKYSPAYYDRVLPIAWQAWKSVCALRQGVLPVAPAAASLLQLVWKRGRVDESARAAAHEFARLRRKYSGVYEAVLVEMESRRPALPLTNPSKLVVVMPCATVPANAASCEDLGDAERPNKRSKTSESSPA